METELEKALNNSLRHHQKEPSRYYLGEGRSEGIKECKNVFRLLRLLSRQCIDSFYVSSEAIPIHEYFKCIKLHIDQISVIYISKETELINEFLRRLQPKNPNPLRYLVLTSTSVFSARVFIHPTAFQPDPIESYVDGYFNLVVDLDDSLIRIPLFRNDAEGPVTLPPALRFKGINPADEKQIKDFFFNVVPQRGRQIQLSAFVSILNGTNTVSDYLTSFRRAISSFDLSFATALCALASKSTDFQVIQGLFQVLGCDHYLDLFIRSLSVSALRFVNGNQVSESVDLIGLSNMFSALSISWKIPFHSNIKIKDLITRVCESILKSDFSRPALYLLKCALTLAAYDDPNGMSSIMTLFEIVLRPISQLYGLINELEIIKKRLLSGEYTSDGIRVIIESTILKILGSQIKIQLSSRKAKLGIKMIHKFIQNNLSEFLEFVIMLNERPKLEHPVMLMLAFSYHMSVKHALL